MEKILKNKIEKFLSLYIGNGYGSGNGSGNGYDYGYGYGSGSGDGSGSGYVDGNGYGSGNGSDSGYGDGDGNGYGSGEGYVNGSGEGYGYDDGSGLKTINKKEIYIIDEVPTIITHIVKNIAKGFIVKTNLLLEPCYIAKGNNYFAHGETLEKANQALQEKIFENLDTDEAIEQFRKKFNNKDSYSGEEFYTWHHILTGSCKMGRKNFIENHDLSLENKYTVKEFIKLCKNDYGGDIIKKLKKFY